jgi:formate hydrogenlyase subunit 6/NADH:ubiquinone oxidoreductase subunit I
MSKLGKMIPEVLRSVFKKPATNMYPFEKLEMPAKFRGKLKFYPEKCIGCKLCMRDCPSAASVINKLEDNTFEARINLGRCIYCAQCVDTCPKKALEASRDVELAQLDPKNLKVVYNAGSSSSVKTQDKKEG